MHYIRYKQGSLHMSIAESPELRSSVYGWLFSLESLWFPWEKIHFLTFAPQPITPILCSLVRHPKKGLSEVKEEHISQVEDLFLASEYFITRPYVILHRYELTDCVWKLLCLVPYLLQRKTLHGKLEWTFWAELAALVTREGKFTFSKSDFEISLCICNLSCL